MATTTVKLLEETLVSPPAGAAIPTTVPLTHFDIFWLNLPPVQRLFFYAVPDLTISHFTSSIVHRLKSSLSFTLQHFFPLSGRLLLSWPRELPCICCADDDSVPVTVCETDIDFNHLAGDSARSFAQLQAMLPKLAAPAADKKDDVRDERPQVAVQITAFPNSGFSIGVTCSHAAADGRSMVHFIKSWASICKSGGDQNCIFDTLPIHNRDSISDPGNKIAAAYMKVALSRAGGRPPPTIPVDKFRYTFVIDSLQVKELKTWMVKKSVEYDQPLRVSTFMVTCALVWVCLLQVEQETTQPKTKDETLCHFLFLADFRERLNLSRNYFGNCLRACQATAKRAHLEGEDGVYEAAKAIGRGIEEMEKEGMNGAEDWLKRFGKLFASGELLVTVAGSPKFGVYDTDFGWGRPEKVEIAHIGSFQNFAIAESTSEVGAVEFGFAFTAQEFDVFNHAFHHRFNSFMK